MFPQDATDLHNPSENSFAVVELDDGTVTSVSLDKFLASKMTIIEECDATRITEKTAYWERIYHPKPEQPDNLKYHFYNPIRNRHFWSTESDPNSLRCVRHGSEYVLMN